MKNLRVLHLEDNPDDASTMGAWVKEAWEGLNRGIDIRIEVVNTVSDAKKWLDKFGQDCDLFLVDLGLSPEEGATERPDGIQAIQYAAKKNAHIGVIVVSQLRQSQVQKAMAAGAHGYISKDIAYDSHDYKYVLSVIETTLSIVGKVPWRLEEISIEYDRRSLPLRSIVESVGEDNLKVLVLSLVEREIVAVRPTYVRPGLSGAVVLCVELEYKMRADALSEKRSEKFLLKCDRDLGRLQTEYRNERRLHWLSQSMRLGYVQKDPVTVQSFGWYACANEFHTSAMDFQGWIVSLNGRDRKKKIEKCLQNLFLSSSGLCHAFKSTLRSNESNLTTPAYLVASLSSRLKANALRAISDFQPMVSRLSISSDLSLVRRFLEEEVVGHVFFGRFREFALECWNHGDFHSRNALVDPERDEAIVIDPADIGWAHLGTDIARLCVDLLVGAWDSGEESFFWDRVHDWQSLCRSLIVYGPESRVSLENARANAGVGTALNWLRQNLTKLTENDERTLSEWEFRLLLSIEFIRFATFQSVPMPKRVVALAAAVDAIQGAIDVLPNDALRG
jgi:CheY-like chemotaxis protein